MIKTFFIRHTWKVIVGLSVIAFLALILHNALVRHWSLGSYYYDLGIMHQVVYNTSKGHFFQMTDPNTNAAISRFAIHADPLMVIFAPFY